MFAGEDIDCQITFKNVAEHAAAPPSNSAAAGGFASLSDKQRKPSAAQGRNIYPRTSPPNKGHRATLSLSAPISVERLPSGPGSWAGVHSKVPNAGNPHKRSVSIISIGASESIVENTASHVTAVDGSRRMSKGHGRSASLQIVPRRHGMNGGLPSGRSTLIFHMRR